MFLPILLGFQLILGSSLFFIQTEEDGFFATEIWLKTRVVEFKMAKNGQWYLLPLEGVQFVAEKINMPGGQGGALTFQSRFHYQRPDAHKFLKNSQRIPDRAQWRLAVLESLSQARSEVKIPWESWDGVPIGDLGATKGDDPLANGGQGGSSPIIPPIPTSSPNESVTFNMEDLAKEQSTNPQGPPDEQPSVLNSVKEGFFGFLKNVKTNALKSIDAAVEEEMGLAKEDNTKIMDEWADKFKQNLSNQNKLIKESEAK